MISVQRKDLSRSGTSDISETNQITQWDHFMLHWVDMMLASYPIDKLPRVTTKKEKAPMKET